MGKFVRGDIVVVPFPFSDLTDSKRRPALVLTDLKGDDIILCQITSKNRHDSYSIVLDDSDFELNSVRKKAPLFKVFDEKASKTRLSKFLKTRQVRDDCFKNESNAVFG